MATGIIDPQFAGTALLCVTQAVGAFNTFLPSLSEVRKASDAGETAADVRMGEVAAACLTLGIGAVASLVIGNGIPFALSVIAASSLVALYEFTLRGKPFSSYVATTE